jgi:UDP-N-acetylmuramoyl-tripeptide--D-alanyl-D-alanine ligase
MKTEKVSLKELNPSIALMSDANNLFLPIQITVDSRDVENRDAFLAISGTRHDGHDFIGQALNRGACLIIGRRSSVEPWLQRIAAASASAILFENRPEDDIIELARQYLRKIAPKVIAVTGSVGKTTTRSLLARVLSSRYKVHQARKSHNTALGCAMTILSMPRETEILILEMGCNHPGEIAQMVELFPPHIAIITEVALAHLEGLATIEGVLRAKLEIAQSRCLEVLSYNIDNDLLRKDLSSQSGLELIPVGFHGQARMRLVAAQLKLDQGQPCLTVQGQWQGEDSMTIVSSLFGRHHAYSLAFAAAIGRYLDIPYPQDALIFSGPIPGRGAIRQLSGGGIVIDESYNANPLSMKAALSAFAELFPSHDGWAVLGAMEELGNQSFDLHHELLSQAPLPAHLLLVGQGWPNSKLPPSAMRLNSLEEAAEILRSSFKSSSSILIKGSRIWKLEKLVEAISEL